MNPNGPETDAEVPTAELERIARGIAREEEIRIQAAHRELFANILASLSPEESALKNREIRAPIDLL